MSEHVGYNVHRWYQPGPGRYTRIDPMGPGGSGVPTFFQGSARPRSEAGEVVRGQGRIRRWIPHYADFALAGDRPNTDINPYTYTASNPLALVDPLGLACGPGKLGDLFVPDKVPGLFDFEEPCRRHDECFCTCGKQRKLCDHEFLRDLMDTCESGPLLLRLRCRTWARVYFAAVRFGGRRSFEGSQQDSGCAVFKKTNPGVFTVNLPSAP